MDNQENEASIQTQYRAEADTTPVQLDGKTKIGGLDYKTAAVLCYVPVLLINLVASLVFVNSEPKTSIFVRFHAMQSLVMMVALMVIGIAYATAAVVIGFIPLLGPLVVGVLNLVWTGVMILFLWQSLVTLIAASKGEMKRIPYVAQIADERLAQS